MSPANSLESILERIKERPEINEVTLVSRSGMHVSGDVPQDAHRETFVAMSAILLGSAETATSELDDELSYVSVKLKESIILIQDAGPSVLLVSRLEKDAEIEEVLDYTKDFIEDIQNSL